MGRQNFLAHGIANLLATMVAPNLFGANDW
jgi:hypothetical protein